MSQANVRVHRSVEQTLSAVALRAGGVAVCALALAAIATCADSTAPKGQVSGIVLRAPSDSLLIGRTVRFVAVAAGDSAVVAQPAFAWTSSDTTVAVVDSTGVVLGLAEGYAVIAAELGGRRDSLHVRVALLDPMPGVAFAELSSGEMGVCAIAVSSEVYCSIQASTDPTPVFTLLPKSAGRNLASMHTTIHSRCGLTHTGTMLCWGSNRAMHFGNGMPHTFRADTAPVVGAYGMRFTSLSVGGHAQTCGVAAADSVVYCFGHNDNYQLGRGIRSDADTAVAPITGALRARAVATDHFHSCAIALDQTAHCWGQNGSGQGGSGPAPQPTSAAVSGSADLVAIDAGLAHTCAIDAARDALCWGGNLDGQLGTGAARAMRYPVPTRVAGALKFAVVRAYWSHTCGITLDGALYCWGAFPPVAVSARLGMRVYEPVRVAPGRTFRSVSASQEAYGCGLTTEGRLLCW